MTESKTTELKREYNDSIKNTITAFANCCGGTIYIGINDVCMKFIRMILLMPAKVLVSIKVIVYPDMYIGTMVQKMFRLMILLFPIAVLMEL